MAFPYDSGTTTAISNLSTYYNGGNYNVGSDPGGFGQGGHRQNFLNALKDVATVASAVSDAATAAATSATNAGTSETNAAASAAKLSGTSASSVSIGTGSKSFTTQASKFFNVGAYLNIRSAANPTVNFMIGQVTAYSGTSLTVNVSYVGGSGTFTDWTIDVSAAPGQTGIKGDTGPMGTSPAIQWNFSTGVTDADPGNGLFKFSSATSSAITFIYFDNLNKDATDVTAWLDALDDSTNTANRGRLFCVEPSDATKFVTLKITGAVTDGTGYRKVPVTPVAWSASSVPFDNASAIAIDFSPSGDRGADGGGAGTVIADTTPVTDQAIVLYNGTTGAHIAGGTVGIGTSGANVGRLDGNNSYSGTSSFAGRVDVQQDFRLSGDISPSQITSDQNDYSPTGLSTASILRLNTDASRNITGLAGGADGRVIFIFNVGSTDIVLKDQSSSSTAANRFLFGADKTIRANQGVDLIYDSTSTRWRATGRVVTSADISDSTATGRSVLTAADIPTALKNIGVDQVTTHGDSAYSILSTDRFVATSATLTASRTWTLPAASALNPGAKLIVADVAGGVTSANTIVVARAGSDTINGGSGSVTLNMAYAYVELESDGTSKWTIIRLYTATKITLYTSGSGTHTWSPLCKKARVRLVGGGSGGASGDQGGTTGGNGSGGGDTTFGSLTGHGASASTYGGQQPGGAGGTASGGNIANVNGGSGGWTPVAGSNRDSAGGANAPFGLGIGGATVGGTTAGNAGSGYGSGGGGGGAGGGATVAGSGGGSGGGVEHLYTAPTGTASYAVGALGAGSTKSGANAGGNGAPGIIIVEEEF